ncbi:MAG TPA: HD-GYP domain-containing protein [Firmicutes bacterium]|jgi:HD-GYP domain-containing protein (c-di-GMP phosphodiesterase class II)|nr:HD-GYP domain-containing protein [Bacillota bacterium]
MRKVPTRMLQAGMKIARPIYDSSGNLLLNSGIVLKREYIARLQSMLIPSVYIEDKLIPDIAIEDVIQEETRQEAMNLLKATQNAVNNGHSEKDAHEAFFVASKELYNVLDDIIQQLLGNPDLIVNLTDIRTADNDTFAHSVNVAVLALISALAMGFTRSDLKKLGMGAFLHDLGKIKIPPSILNKQEPLLPEEFSIIKKHPRDGYELVKSQYLIEPSSCAVVLQHHERINGKGYPRNLKGEEIHTLTKICSIADVYDALTAERPYRSALLPHEALEIMGNNEDEFDLTFLQSFLRHVAAYPVGTVVGLSSDEIGIVTKNFAGYSSRPRVRVFWTKDLQKVEPYEVNLMERLNVVIDKVFREEEVSKLSLF